MSEEQQVCGYLVEEVGLQPDYAEHLTWRFRIERVREAELMTQDRDLFIVDVEQWYPWEPEEAMEQSRARWSTCTR